MSHYVCVFAQLSLMDPANLSELHVYYQFLFLMKNIWVRKACIDWKETKGANFSEASRP